MYSGLDDPRRWRFPEVLDEQSQLRGSTTWITTTDGESLSFESAAREARQVASWFADHGVKAGDLVGIMLPNGIDFVRAWLGLQYLGATAVLLNTGLAGPFLEHQLVNSGVALLVTDPTRAATVAATRSEEAMLKCLAVVSDRVPAQMGDLPCVDFGMWRTSALRQAPYPSAGSIACIMYTSGTSGPAKGVLMPHAHCVLYGIGAARAFEVTARDRYYITLPLFHSNGLLMQLGTTLLAGITAIVRERFSASEWLQDIRQHGATITHLLGALAAFVIAQPASALERNHPLRAVLNGPNIPEIERVLRERFGIADVLSGFGMTEVNIPIWGRLGHSTPGAAGWVDTRHFEVIIAHPETDEPCDRDEIGEILVRPKIPFGFMAGYHGMPERTVEAWRNLWFHTGDAGRMSADGLVTFVDRIKDCIRRRGENIAPLELERQVLRLPGIAEAAAFAVPSDILGGEDEIMIALVAPVGECLDLAAVGDALEGALPRFARPRYLQRVDALPKTVNGKVQRSVLRQRGAAHAYDRGPGYLKQPVRKD